MEGPFPKQGWNQNSCNRVDFKWVILRVAYPRTRSFTVFTLFHNGLTLVSPVINFKLQIESITLVHENKLRQ
jgi:hypothetical protein